jgi:hypothetical protein
LAGASCNDRLQIRTRTFEPTAAAHNDFFVGNVSFAIRKRTLATVNFNDRCGSILVVQVGLQAPHWMTGSG